jgi:outer membrane lipoprotein SlyB
MRNSIRTGTAVLAALWLAGCVTAPPRVEIASAAPPVPDTSVYFYPAADRPAPTADQENRDRYECSIWATQQSHFDPSVPSTAPSTRTVVIDRGPPDGTRTLLGASSGALLGAAVSNPWHAGQGALLGAVAGAVIGGVADSEHHDAVEHAAADAQVASSSATVSQEAGEYRRAMGACLEGRGYSVG